MRIVDCHLHLGLTPEHVPRWWMEELYRPYGIEVESIDGDFIVNVLDRFGIDAGLVQGGDIRRTTWHPDHPDEHDVYVPNEYTAEQVALHPGRLYGVCGLDPLRDVQASVIELEKCVTEYGFRSLKLLPSYQHYSPSDRRLDPVYEKARELDVPVHFFTGMSPTINTDLRFGDPVLLDEVGRRFRDLKVIVYINFPWIDQCVALVAKHPNFYADMCYFAGGTEEDLYHAMMKFKSYGALDRVLFGTDNADKARAEDEVGSVPDKYRAMNSVAERLGGDPITDDELEAIMGGTASRIYKLDP